MRIPSGTCCREIPQFPKFPTSPFYQAIWFRHFTFWHCDCRYWNVRQSYRLRHWPSFEETEHGIEAETISLITLYAVTVRNLTRQCKLI
jgi:hypothetical protein